MFIICKHRYINAIVICDIIDMDLEFNSTLCKKSEAQFACFIKLADRFQFPFKMFRVGQGLRYFWKASTLQDLIILNMYVVMMIMVIDSV